MRDPESKPPIRLTPQQRAAVVEQLAQAVASDLISREDADRAVKEFTDSAAKALKSLPKNTI